MKLNVVPARTGLRWTRTGVRTFFRQPIALAGLFFLFMAAMSMVSFVPVIGVALALAMLPGATLGLMAAAQQADQGKFPLPSILVTAFRAGRQRLRAMLILGAAHAACVLLVMGASALVDGGSFARLYLLGAPLTSEIALSSQFQRATWLALALYTPVSMMFWHAPALVHWHGVTPLKSLFFSFVACGRNFGAYTLFALSWAVMSVLAAIAVTLLSLLLNNPEVVNAALVALVVLMATMFFTSVYFTFRDSFVAVDELLDAPLAQELP